MTNLHILVPVITRGTLARPHELKSWAGGGGGYDNKYNDHLRENALILSTFARLFYALRKCMKINQIIRD